MKKVTLLFCIKDNQILLGMKKINFGTGKWNGYGGKVEEGETIESAAVRELQEESGLVAKESDIKKHAVLRFYFADKPMFECHTFITYTWTGEPVESDEMIPSWHPPSELPFHDMWAADAVWLPIILKGERIDADVIFNEDGSEMREFKPIYIN